MTPRRRLARVGAAVIVLAQLILVVRAYSADHAFFGFQMFPESSEWRATIERELTDGSHVGIDQPWPGGYSWSEMVAGRGLSNPHVRHHADAGLRSTTHFLEAAIEWVLANTPDDHETVGITATVERWWNGRELEPVVIEVER